MSIAMIEKVHNLSEIVRHMTKTVETLMDNNIRTLEQISLLAQRSDKLEGHNRELMADFMELNRDMRELAAEVSPPDDDIDLDLLIAWGPKETGEAT